MKHTIFKNAFLSMFMAVAFFAGPKAAMAGSHLQMKGEVKLQTYALFTVQEEATLKSTLTFENVIGGDCVLTFESNDYACSIEKRGASDTHPILDGMEIKIPQETMQQVAKQLAKKLSDKKRRKVDRVLSKENLSSGVISAYHSGGVYGTYDTVHQGNRYVSLKISVDDKAAPKN